MDLVPDAKRVLLTAYADTDAAIRAINDVDLDHYLLKPWDPPEELLYPVLDELLADWSRPRPARRSTGLTLVGHQWSAQTQALKEFLARNQVPYRHLDVRSEARQRLLAAGRLEPRRRRAAAVVFMPDGEVLHPSVAARAGRAGRAVHHRGQPVLRPRRRRRRAGRARCRGVRRQRGPAHPARRVVGHRRPGRAEQPHRELPRLPQRGLRRRAGPARPRPGGALRRRDRSRAVEVVDVAPSGEGRVRALRRRRRGHRARRGPVHRGRLHPAARQPASTSSPAAASTTAPPRTRRSNCGGEDVYIVGAANSAGQAALHFAKYAGRVVMLVRGPDLRRQHVGVPGSRIEDDADDRGAHLHRDRRRRAGPTTSSS